MIQILIPAATTLYMLSKRIKKYYAYELKVVQEQPKVVQGRFSLTPKYFNSSIYDEKINHSLVITKSFYVLHKNFTPIDKIKYKYPHENITIYLDEEQKNMLNIKPKYEIVV